MLASYRLSRSTLNNRGESRTYRRETWLSERIMKQSGHYCSNCLNEIPAGVKYAATDCFLRLCQNCYGNLPEALALATVTIDDSKCITVRYSTYRGVDIHDFNDCAVIFSEGGFLYRFRDLNEAQACVDAAISMANGHATERGDGARNLSILSSVMMGA